MGEHLRHDLPHRPVLIAFFPQFDEEGVLGEAAGVEVKRDAVLVGEGGHLPDVSHGHRLPAHGVVGDGEHDQRNALRPHLGDELLQGPGVHVAFEGMYGLGDLPFGDHQVHRPGTLVLHVGPGGVEVGVVGHHVALLVPYGILWTHDREQYALGGPALVGGDDVLKAEDRLHRCLEAPPAGAAGIGLVPTHGRRPLLAAHGSRAAVGEQVDEHVLGAKGEEVVVGRLQDGLPLRAGGHANRLNGLDTEGLDDGLHGGLLHE